jgi:hypothetical protein
MNQPVTIRGAVTAARRLRDAAKKVRINQHEAVALAAEMLAGECTRTTRGSRTRAKRKRRPVTAPSGILGIDTGFGRQSIGWTWKRQGALGSNPEASVSSPVDYMNIQELRGTYRWLKPTVDRIRAKLTRAITVQIVKGL